ncbi:MAG: hypothetical protein RLZZ206_3969, partial [Cyanobacteriota bacterium]
MRRFIEAAGGNDRVLTLQAGDHKISGRAPSRQRVHLYCGGRLIASIRADRRGRYSFSLTPEQLRQIGEGSGKSLWIKVKGRSSRVFSAAVDTQAPSLAITTSTAGLIAGQTATITFTFSEAPSGFTAAAITTTGGAISGLAATADPAVYTATFTPTAGSSGTAAISVAAGSYSDAAGNAGGAGTTPALSYDTLAPTLSISSSASTLKVGETATISFTFSEVPSGFTAADITTSGGAISGLVVSTDPKVYTATFTPTAGSSGTAAISVAAGSYSDAAGNAGGAGTTPALSYDTLAPTL